MAAPDAKKELVVSNPHKGIGNPGDTVHTVLGDFCYYHYGCDGQDDRVCNANTYLPVIRYFPPLQFNQGGIFCQRRLTAC